MIRYFLILLCAIFLGSCSPKRVKNLPPAVFIPTLNLMTEVSKVSINLSNTIITPSISVLILERKPCPVGKCPAYRVEFFEDGLVQYEGKAYVDKYGKYETQISQEKLTALLTMAKNIGYLDFQNRYPTSGQIIYDVPLTVSYVQHYAEVNHIENHHNAPVPLIRFEQHIEELIEYLEWKQIK
ncbi:MAG: DUF6438 domain-containing protein [Saprospiraceae bacterium]